MKTPIILCLALACLLSATTAQATVWTADFLGTVTSGSEQIGLGGPSADLAKLPVELKIIFDTDVGYGFGYSELGFAGANDEAPYEPGPVVMTIVIVNGHRYASNGYSRDGRNSSAVYGYNSSNPVSGYFCAVAYPAGACGSSTTPPGFLTGPVTMPFNGGYGGFRITNSGSTIDGALAPSSVSIYQSSNGLPEPLTWLLMVIGFGGTGEILRRRSAYPRELVEGGK